MKQIPSKENTILSKRKWHYLLHPVAFDMRCDHCWDGDLGSDTGVNIYWSEFEGMIWCYDCQIDTYGFPGIFGGPIAIHAVYLMGLHFDRFNLETGEIERLNIKHLDETGELVWDSDRIATKNMLKGKYLYGEDLRERGRELFELVGKNGEEIKIKR
jgi:hypothetical protein